MSKISRKKFLQQGLSLAAFASLYPYSSSATENEDFYNEIVSSNNKEVKKIIDSLKTELTEVKRRLGFDIANLAAAYTEPKSTYYQDQSLVGYMEQILSFLIKNQKSDGTLDLGNLASPPDTAFILEPICGANVILNRISNPNLTNTKKLLKDFILSAGESMTTGGVHTPNHRWVISAALARINELYPNKKYLNRINQWLSENVYIDADGHYLERSMVYSEVTDNSLITIARLANKPKLYEYVRKNLNMTYFYMEPNGDLVTNDSRRQDQYMSINSAIFYLDYRFMAINEGDSEYAAICKFIENLKGFSEKNLPDLLFYFNENPILKKTLPSPHEPLQNFEKFFKTTDLVRIRRNSTTVTIFGGTDKPTIIASGRSNSPNIFSYRKGEAILKYLRFSTDFFSTGYFKSDEIKKVENKYILSQRIEAPYYQPLPEKLKRTDGNYTHAKSTDGRFWNKMDFQNRPQSNINVLETKITIEEKEGEVYLYFEVNGAENVKVTIEFCFKEGGQLNGFKQISNGQDNYTLESGFGEYIFGKDKITFGEGIFKHNKISGLEGELYSTHFGTLRTDGLHVFLTGKTPFQHKIKLS